MPKPGIAIFSGPWEAEPWAAPVRELAPDRPLFVWPDAPDRAMIGYALVWRAPEGMLGSLPNLRVIFSLGAGVDHLVLQPDLPDVPIVRVVSDDLTARMTEWTVLQVLLHHRRQRFYDRQQRERRWHELPQPAASEVRVGIMGMGVMGRAAAAALLPLGFRVGGWSRSGAAVAGVEMFGGAAGLDPFLARTDSLVSLLPLTPATRGILAMPLFRKLAGGGAFGRPVLINAGRGGLQIEADIVQALDEGVLGGASLDVFETEPLPAASPLWGREDVVVTPHAAGFSAPAALVPPMLRQIEAFEAGRPLANVVNRAAGY
jgi:glyoxylate/hydroxypyruvate reductase A